MDRRQRRIVTRAATVGALALLATTLTTGPASAADRDLRKRCSGQSCQQTFEHSGRAELVDVLGVATGPLGVEPRWLDAQVIGPDGRVVCRSTFHGFGPAIWGCRIVAPGRYTASTSDRLRPFFIDLTVHVEQAPRHTAG